MPVKWFTNRLAGLGPDRYSEARRARRARRKVRAPSANDCFLDDRRTRLPEVP
jgi:hypothetical protein